MIGHCVLLRAFFLHSPNKGFWAFSRGFTPGHAQTAGELGFVIQFNAATLWHFAHLGLDSPE